MQPQTPPQRPLTWWRRGMLWIVFAASALGVTASLYASSYREAALLGVMLSVVLFLASGFTSYLAIFPKNLVQKYQHVAHNTSNVAFTIFGVALLVLTLTVWWGAAIA